MQNDVIWIVTDETPVSKDVTGERDGRDTGNPYNDAEERFAAPRRGFPVKAEQLEQEMKAFVQVMGRVLAQAKDRAQEVGGMTLEAIELSVEVNGEGQVSLLGMGGKVGGKGAMTLKFKAAKPGTQPQSTGLGGSSAGRSGEFRGND
jgi:hypothetical protein